MQPSQPKAGRAGLYCLICSQHTFLALQNVHSLLICLPTHPPFQTSAEKDILPIITWYMPMTPNQGVLPTPSIWMLYGLLPKPPDKMASYFNLSFLLLPLIQSILLCIRDSTGERKVFEKCFYDLKREIRCSKWRAIALCSSGAVWERVNRCTSQEWDQRQMTHTWNFVSQEDWIVRKAVQVKRQM